MNKNFEVKNKNVKDIVDQMVSEASKEQIHYVCVNEKLKDILTNNFNFYTASHLVEGKGIGTIGGLMIYLDETLPNSVPMFNVTDF